MVYPRIWMETDSLMLKVRLHILTWSLLTSTVAMINIVETSMNLAYVYLAHISKWPGAPLIGFTSAVMTVSKTVLYLAQEFYCHFCAPGQNSLQTWIVYWIIPNGYAMITFVKFAQLTTIPL